MRRLLLPGLALLTLALPVGAQERVEVSFTEGFEDPLPLEVPFRVVGKAPPGVERIVFSYAPAAGEAAGYLPVAEPQEWRRVHGDEFSFRVLPLHHRKRYRFEWRAELTVRALERQVPGTAAAAARVVRRFAALWEGGGVELESVEELERTLAEVLLGPAAGARARIDREGLDALVADTLATELLRADFEANHGALCDRLAVAVGRGERAAGEDGEVLAAVRELVAGSVELTPASQVRWRSVIDPRDRNSGASLEDVSTLVLWMHDDPQLLRDLLAGRRTMHRDSLLEVAADGDAPADEHRAGCAGGGADLGSLGLLAEAFVGWAALETSDGPLLAGDAAVRARRWAEALRAYRDDAAELRRHTTTASERLHDGLVTLTLDAPVEWVATATAVPARTHPYVGLDLGVAWVPAFDGVAFYTAAHLYAVPVNRRAAPGIHRGADVLLKRLSLMAGLAVAGVERAGREHAAGAGSPMLGVGLRLTRDLRASGGVLWYDDADAVTRRVAFASLSVDIDLAGFVGRLGRLFGT